VNISLVILDATCILIRLTCLSVFHAIASIIRTGQRLKFVSPVSALRRFQMLTVEGKGLLVKSDESLKSNSIGSELVRSRFEPDSVMEFGFYRA